MRNNLVDTGKPDRETVLLVPAFNHTLESLIPVAHALRGRGLRPVFVIDWAGSAPVRARCRQEAFEYVAVGDVGVAAEGPGAVRRVASRVLSTDGSRGWVWQLRQAAIGLRRTFKHVSVSLRRSVTARRLFDRYRPRAAVISSARTQGLGAFVLRQAHRTGVPSILAPQERLRGRDDLVEMRRNANRTLAEAPLYERALMPLARVLAPGILSGAGVDSAVFVQPEKAILGRLFDVWPEDPWVRGRVPVTRYAVQSEAYRRLAESEGVPAERLVVVGYPPYDALYETLQEGPEAVAAARERISAELGLPKEGRLVVFAGAATNQYLNLGAYTDRATYEADIALLVRTVLDAALDACVLYKAHPRDEPEDYRFLQGVARTTVSQDVDMNTAVYSCDVFLTSLSSTMFRAIMLDKTTLTYDFYDNPVYDRFVARYPGHTSLRDRDRLRSEVDRVLNDDAERERLAEGRRAFRREYANLDGAASERFANLVEELAHTTVPIDE